MFELFNLQFFLGLIFGGLIVFGIYPYIFKKKGKIINFVNRSKQNKKIQTNRDEFERLDALAKELVDVY